jgi:ribosomal protein S18 acetylase RimI-like enzyme
VESFALHKTAWFYGIVGRFETKPKGMASFHMDKEYDIVYTEKPEWAVIGGGISAFNKEQAGDGGDQNLCFVLQWPDEEIVGGVIGETHWGWFYINLMWIKEEFRGRGYGHRLMTMAEDEARKRGAKYAYLDTFSFQSPDFYKQHGYEVFGELQDFPAGHQRYYMKKKL